MARFVAALSLHDLLNNESTLNPLGLSPYRFMEKNSNPNVLGQRDAMRADKFEKLIEYIKEKIENIHKNRIYTIVPISSVHKEKTTIEAVRSHRWKVTPTREVYRHVSHICVNRILLAHRNDYEEIFP